MRRCFRETDCVVLPRPVNEDEKLRTLDQLKYTDLAPEFREEYVVLELRSKKPTPTSTKHRKTV